MSPKMGLDDWLSPEMGLGWNPENHLHKNAERLLVKISRVRTTAESMVG